MSKLFCAIFFLLAFAVYASTSFSILPDDVLYRIIEMIVLRNFKTITTLPLVSRQFSNVASFQSLIRSSDPFVTSYVNIVKQQWANGQSLLISDFNLRWGDITKQHAFLTHVIESSETRYHLSNETVEFLCTALTFDFFHGTWDQGIESFVAILTSRPPYTEMTDKGKEMVLKSLMIRDGESTSVALTWIRQNAHRGLSESYETAIRVMISGKNSGFFAERLYLFIALDCLVVAGRLGLSGVGKVLLQKVFQGDSGKLNYAVYTMLADEDFDVEGLPGRKQYKEQLVTAIFEFDLLPVIPYREYFTAFRSKSPIEFLDFCIKTPRFPFDNLPSCLAMKLLASHHCKQVDLEEASQVAGINLVTTFGSDRLEILPLICNTGWARELEMSENDRATSIRAFGMVNKVLRVLDNVQDGQQEARDFVYKHFSYYDFIPSNQHYDFWMAMARHVREDEKKRMLEELKDITKQHSPQGSYSFLPLRIVLKGELREKWSVDEIATIVKILGRAGAVKRFNEDQINILCTLLAATDPSLIANTVLTVFCPMANEADSEINNEVFKTIASTPLCDHFVSILLLQFINPPLAKSPAPHFLGLLDQAFTGIRAFVSKIFTHYPPGLVNLLSNIGHVERWALFGQILTRHLPEFANLSDKQVNDALDAFKAAIFETSHKTDIVELHFLLDALTAEDERAVGILMGRSGWKWGVGCGYCPKEWFDDPAKRQKALLALRILHLKKTGQ